ncbi:unnamed protein product [Ranitomeya imitator]|uniref:Uncharacterized protein n=1 Tax=Ranitomeya imitator TaxID=111125 RepID=A0ABN9ML94_9NEOB|nr:unnamed protein product [Ranitomeya imitator]
MLQSLGPVKKLYEPQCNSVSRSTEQVYSCREWRQGHIWYLKSHAEPVLSEDRRQSVSRQPSFTYSEWTDDKVEEFHGPRSRARHPRL